MSEGRIVLFAGTSEGRLLAETLKELHLPAVVSVFSEYGASLLEEGPALKVRYGALNEAEMEALLQEEQAELVIDATHPFAREVSRSLAEACAALQLPLWRTARKAENLTVPGLRCFADFESMLKALAETEGPVFSTLGVKEAELLSRLPGFAERVTLRVLPLPEGLERCLKLGWPAARLIGMQGPFSRELNAAMFRSCGARFVLSKDSGERGGFAEKRDAAADAGAEFWVVVRPEEEGGRSPEEIIEALKQRAEERYEHKG